MKYRISGGTLITEHGEEKKDLLIADGKIEAIVDPDAAGFEAYQIVSCDGLYVSPGFVDIHQHGGGGGDYMDGSVEAYLQAAHTHLRHGTTSLMPTLTSADSEELIDAIRAYHAAKADERLQNCFLGIHVEGPYLSPAQGGAQSADHIRVFEPAEYVRITEEGRGEIRRWSVAPELDGAEAFAAYAREHQIVLSIAHSNADFDTVVRAFDWGFRHVTHLYSCVSTITRHNGFRVPGVLEAAYYLDDMDVEIIADGCHLPHSLLAYVAKFKKKDRITLITDSMRAAGQNVTRSYLGSAEAPTPVIIEDDVAKLEDRSAFGGSVATADRLIRNMLKCGVSLVEAVQMITVNPLRSMGLDLPKGKLCPGYDADLCVFDQNINVQKVFCGGKLVVG